MLSKLHEVIESLSGQLTTFSVPATTSSEPTDDLPLNYEKDFQYIFGHRQAKRALEIAAAGEHNVLMTGPPGCGKSLLSEIFPTIFPLLKQESQSYIHIIYNEVYTRIEIDNGEYLKGNEPLPRSKEKEVLKWLELYKGDIIKARDSCKAKCQPNKIPPLY